MFVTIKCTNSRNQHNNLNLINRALYACNNKNKDGTFSRSSSVSADLVLPFNVIHYLFLHECMQATLSYRQQLTIISYSVKLWQHEQMKQSSAVSHLGNPPPWSEWANNITTNDTLNMYVSHLIVHVPNSRVCCTGHCAEINQLLLSAAGATAPLRNFAKFAATFLGLWSVLSRSFKLCFRQFLL